MPLDYGVDRQYSGAVPSATFNVDGVDDSELLPTDRFPA